MTTEFQTMHDLMRFLGCVIKDDPEQDAESLSSVLFKSSDYSMWAELPDEYDRREGAELVVGVNVESSMSGDATFTAFITFPLTLDTWERALDGIEERAADCLAEWAAEGES